MLFYKQKKVIYFSCFSLLEILIVIGILSVIVSITFVILNPSELIKRGRDSQRLADIDSLDKSLSLFILENGSVSLGSTSLVYVSLPDSTSSCTSWVLPLLPAGYSYSCKTESTFNKTDGTGWIPVNFDSLSFKSPIVKVPIDPINDENNFYSFVVDSNQSWEVSTNLESTSLKMGGDKDRVSTDGGSRIHLFEKGRRLDLIPIDYGDNSLVGWWRLDESSGTSLKDLSGNSYNLTAKDNDTTDLTCSDGNTPPLVSSDGKYAYSRDFDGCDDTSQLIGSPQKLMISGDTTHTIWLKLEQDLGFLGAIMRWSAGNISIALDASEKLLHNIYTDDLGWINRTDTGSSVSLNQWTHLAIVRSISENKVKFYKNGSFSSSVNLNAVPTTVTPLLNFFVGSAATSQYVGGKFNDLRIYNRALSEQEILAIYNSLK